MVLYIVVNVCNGICDSLKVKKAKRPVYKFQRRCKKCSVYYALDTKICPCCKCLTRSKPHSRKDRERYNSETIRIDCRETRYLHSTMLST